jgi:hypothetical protein
MIRLLNFLRDDPVFKAGTRTKMQDPLQLILYALSALAIRSAATRSTTSESLTCPPKLPSD